MHRVHHDGLFARSATLRFYLRQFLKPCKKFRSIDQLNSRGNNWFEQNVVFDTNSADPVFSGNHISAKAVEFFKNLVFKHYQSEQPGGEIRNPDQLVRLAFTQWPVFEEFVRAVEGVPRDALNLIGKAVTKSFGHKIAMNDIRAAARDWYHQDKASSIRGNEELSGLLERIVEEIIGERRARAFLFASGSGDPRIEQLFDARLLHILRKNVSSRDELGVRAMFHFAFPTPMGMMPLAL